MSEPHISSILDALRQERSDEECFIIAASVNLYIESLRRVDGRVLLRHDDIRPLFNMIEILLSPPAITAEGKQRSRVLTDEEQLRLLQATEESLGPPKLNPPERRL